MVLNDAGRIAADTWQWLSVRYPYIELDVSVLMPNHLHGIITIHGDISRGGSRTAPTEKRKPLGQLIGAFKTVSTKRINGLRLTPGETFWQRNYYEHVIRNEADLAEVREYILNNPARWNEDDYNPY